MLLKKYISKMFILSLFSIAIPLLLIFISAYLSGWFNLFNNALSDLGHSTKSNVAAIFNFGLSLGGFLMSLIGVKYFSKYSRLIGYLVALTGYSLILISVFNEVYGSLHFAVSTLFFVLLLFTMLIYAIKIRDVKMIALLIILIAIDTLLWYTHFAYRMPKGAAIPELLSIFTAAPFYLHLSWRISSTDT